MLLNIREKDIVTSLHDFSEHLELSLGVEGHEVHASVPAEVTPVKPIPVLEIKSLKKRRYAAVSPGVMCGGEC